MMRLKNIGYLGVGAITNADRRWYMVSVYAVAHLLVDFSCAFLMFRSIAGAEEWYLYLLIYNFFAFAMQMPLGIIADKWNRNYLFAAIGCMLVLAAFPLRYFPALAVIIVGIGNAMFHIGGGIDVLNISTEKKGALGVFVAPGALGIYFGTILGRGSSLPENPLLPVLLLAVGLIFITHRMQGGAYPKNSAFTLAGSISHRMLIAALCLFIVVCLRSYVGLTLSFPWKGSGMWGVVLVCAVVAGKIAGGFAADRFGMVKTSCFSLGIAAFLFLMPQIPVAGIVSVLLFNMTMPITLWAMARVFPGAKGFSFGLLTFGLFVGFLPVHLGVGAFNMPWLFAVAAVVSLALLLISIRKAKL